MVFRFFQTFLLGLFLLSTVSAGEVIWHDSDRNRAIPVKIHFPRSTEPAPVILFSHGLGSSIGSCAYLAKAWTAQGFVSVLVQHPLVPGYH